MTKIESNEKLIRHSAEEVYEFLSNFNNFEYLMPTKITNWTSTEESCYFTVSGLASLGMRIVEKEPYVRLKMLHDGKVPFEFDFNVFIQARGDNSLVQLLFNAKLNPMLKMAAVKPLKKFLQELLDHLEASLDKYLQNKQIV